MPSSAWLDRLLFAPRLIRDLPAPRLTPGIRAHVIIVLGDDGQCGVFPSKLPEEEDVAEIYRTMTTHWVGFLTKAGIDPMPRPES